MERIGRINSNVANMPSYRQPQLISGDQNFDLYDLKRLFGSRPRLMDSLETSIRDTISAKKALDGALIEFWRDDATSAWSIAKTDQHYLVWVRDFFTGKTGSRSDPITFRVEVIDDTHVKFFRSSDGSPMFCHVPDNESMKIIPGAKVSDNSDLFTFCTSSFGSDNIDLSKTTLSQFLQSVWTLRTAVGRPTCAWDTWRSWNSPCAGSDVAARINFIWHKASPFMENLLNYAKDDQFKAQCCMGKVVGENATYCENLALANANDRCDVFMDTFCSTHVDDPFCGCYDTAIDKEALLLPADLQPYISVLKGQPRCWAQGCKAGYLRKNIRDMNSCDITICTSSQTIAGDNNVVDAQGNMFCRGGEPIKKNSGEPNNGSSNGGSPPDAFTEFISKYGMLMLIVMIFIIIIGMLVLIVRSKKNTEITSNYSF